MIKRKKRRLNAEEEQLDLIPPQMDMDGAPIVAVRPKKRFEAKFRKQRIPGWETANETEEMLFKLLKRICSTYNDAYDKSLNQNFVNHHLFMFSIHGMPIDFSAKTFKVRHMEAFGAHSVCSRFFRVNEGREGQTYNFIEVLRLFAWAQRSISNYQYMHEGLAVPTFFIERNIPLLFRMVMTLNSLITTRQWEQLGRYLNFFPFLHCRNVAWIHTARTKNRHTYKEKEFSGRRHDMFISAFYVWQAATLRVLHAEESREWKSSRQLALLRRAISQCKILYGMRVPEHVLLNDCVAVLLSLDEAYMVHQLHRMDLGLDQAAVEYRHPYEALKLLAQSWCWQQDLRIISGVTDPGSLLIEELLEVAEREGSAGVVYALSALRGFMRIAEALDERDAAATLNRLLAYAIGCPRAVRPLAAQLRQFDMAAQAEEMVVKAIEPSSAIHPSDPVWLEWAEVKMKEVDEEDEETHEAVAAALLSYLDYGSNRLHDRAWILLEKAMMGSEEIMWRRWWAERAEWWPHLHSTGEMGKRGEKARRRVLKRFAKVEILQIDR